MQSFRITNGKKYIRKISGKYTTCTTPMMAGTWSFREAQKILENNLPKDWKKEFYLEGVDDLIVLDNETIKQHLHEEEFEKRSFKDLPLKTEDLETLETYISSLSSLPEISREKLICMKQNFKSNVMEFDNELEDIKHWILIRNPPVWMYPFVGVELYKIIRDRARVKQDINYIDGLIKAYEKNYPFHQLIFEIKEREYKKYKPRTKIFGKFETYYKEKMKRKDKKTA